MDFYGRQDYLRRKVEQQKARLRSDQQNSDDADAEKASHDRQGSKKKKPHDRWRKMMKEAEGTQGNFRQRHHRNYCPFHPDNVMQKYTDDTSKMNRCRFAYSELRDTQKRIGMASNGASFVSGLDADIDLDVIFRKLTVEETLERKRSKKDGGGEAKSLIFITGTDVDEVRVGGRPASGPRSRCRSPHRVPPAQCAPCRGSMMLAADAWPKPPPYIMGFPL